MNRKFFAFSLQNTITIILGTFSVTAKKCILFSIIVMQLTESNVLFPKFSQEGLSYFRNFMQNYKQ